jgi:hypothetical protein
MLRESGSAEFAWDSAIGWSGSTGYGWLGPKMSGRVAGRHEY